MPLVRRSRRANALLIREEAAFRIVAAFGPVVSVVEVCVAPSPLTALTSVLATLTDASHETRLRLLF